MLDTVAEKHSGGAGEREERSGSAHLEGRRPVALPQDHHRPGRRRSHSHHIRLRNQPNFMQAVLPSRNLRRRCSSYAPHWQLQAETGHGMMPGPTAVIVVVCAIAEGIIFHLRESVLVAGVASLA